MWSWVLMPTHVHLILVPVHGDAMHRWRRCAAYSRRIYARGKRNGHFWQGRIGCMAIDEPHMLAALRHVALNPLGVWLAKPGEPKPKRDGRSV